MKCTYLAIALAFVAGTACADPVEGLWRTEADDNGNFGHVEIYTCGAALCGVIREAFNSSGAARPSDNIGKRMIWDMKAEGGGPIAAARSGLPIATRPIRAG